MKPLIIAHRGDTINYEENTIEAFKSAFEHGADGIELDTQLDEKGNVIVVHDFGFDRSRSYPLLSYVLEKFSNKGRLEIEMKSPEKENVSKIGDLLNKYRPRSFEVVSLIMPHLTIIKNYVPQAETGLIFNKCLIEDWMPNEYIKKLILNYLELTKANILHLPIDYYDKDLVDFLHANDIKAHAHLANDYDKFTKLLELGIDQTSIDDVTKIKELKSKY